MFPSGFLDEMRKDSQLLGSLAPIRLTVDRLRKQVEDASTQVGARHHADPCAGTFRRTGSATAAMKVSLLSNSEKSDASCVVRELARWPIIPWSEP